MQFSLPVTLLTLSLWISLLVVPTVGQELESQLANVPPEALAVEAKQIGDATRGAIVFNYPHLACTRCHALDAKSPTRIGPDLTNVPLDKRPSDAQLVESLLLPSKRIHPGFESYKIVTTDGRVLTGRIMESDAQRVVVQDAAGTKTVLPAEEIESRSVASLSLMPSGLVNQMGSRQSFLDLVRYLMEVRDGGLNRALELQPPPSMLVLSLPEYESRIDHRALIQNADQEVLKQGEAIYQRVCSNCHGTLEQPGSLPTSLRFAEGKFKNGSDPHSMYQTLSHGFGMMTPQPWMVPKQKYAVIHYIRDAFLQKHNRSQWTEISEDYLARLPKGDTLGPDPRKIEPWSSMDYGPTLTHTYEVPGNNRNLAYKGIAVRLDAGPGGIARGNQWMLFDTDTMRWAAGWESDGGVNRFIDWRGIQFNGQHQVHPKLAGKVVFANTIGPGWAHPETGSFADDLRIVGRDERRYGPLPKSWAQFKGQYRHGPSVIVHYQVESTNIHEMPSMSASQSAEHGAIFVRQLWIGSRAAPLTLRILDESELTKSVRCGVSDPKLDLKWIQEDGRLLLSVPAGTQPIQFAIGIAEDTRQAATGGAIKISTDLDVGDATAAIELSTLLRGDKAAWQQELDTAVQTVGDKSGPFAVDFLTAPENNPWLAQVRLTGLDFLSDGRMVVCAWDGDIWLLTPFSDGASTNANKLRWKRIASGMFQPLGIKVVADVLYVTCRDQLARLHDLNGDNEIDYYECFNNDHQVTEHFHEFAMGLQRDEQGNFYYAKSARHALTALVPHHGTLLQVSADGSSTKIIANGFRAANGVCLNPDGSFFVTDQEGHWTPKNRINWVRRGVNDQPRFYGNMFGYSDQTDASNDAMEKPLCWITNAFDRSPGELLWVDSQGWGALDGSLLNLSYGTGKVFLVPHEKIGETIQGGMIALPIPGFPTGVMRGRFSPHDHHLYLCGMYAWAGSAQHPGGLYRIRATGKPMHLPTELHCAGDQITLRFSDPVSGSSATKENVKVKVWSLKRTANYGSKHFDERELDVKSVICASDAKTVSLVIPELQPTWCMEIEYHFTSPTGTEIQGTIHNTIHTLEK
jgi:putative heme-binding domain-containing protein